MLLYAPLSDLEEGWDWNINNNVSSSVAEHNGDVKQHLPLVCSSSAPNVNPSEPLKGSWLDKLWLAGWEVSQPCFQCLQQATSEEHQGKFPLTSVLETAEPQPDGESLVCWWQNSVVTLWLRNLMLSANYNLAASLFPGPLQSGSCHLWMSWDRTMWTWSWDMELLSTEGIVWTWMFFGWRFLQS